jgi:methylated-DNA-[protein]-cysteine S-methyltransferase
MKIITLLDVEMKYYTVFKTDFGEITLVGDNEGINNLHWSPENSKRNFEIDKNWIRNDEFFTDAVKQVKEYFNGKRKVFELLLNPQGTDFQKKVWGELKKIPYGELRSYKQIAQAAGNKKACRAVGMANSKNPIAIVIPCHRVIGANGTLTGYANGLENKKTLIVLEKSK